MEINVGYILNELRRAQSAKNESEDAGSTERAAKRISRWQKTDLVHLTIPLFGGVR